MAARCTIPCTLGAVEARIRNRNLKTTLPPRVPVLLAGLALLGAAVVVIPLADDWRAGVVVGLFALLGLAVVAGRAFLEASDNTRLGVPAELAQLVEQHAALIHPPRLAELRAEAAALRYDVGDFAGRVKGFLGELRLATGQYHTCRCGRRLPLPLPLPF